MSVWSTLAIVFATRAFLWLLRKYVLNRKPAAPPARANVDPALIASLQKRWDDNIIGLGKTGKQYVVIGTGFLGSRILAALVKRGETRIRAFDIALPADQKSFGDHVEWITGNVTNIEHVRAAVRGADVVYSTFAVIRYWEDAAWQLPASAAVNIDGTNNVVEACIAENVPSLVYTSTSNVNVRKSTDPQEFSESTPYVTNADAPNNYAYTKAVAEQLVLGANGKPLANGDKFSSVCVRPCSGIYGLRDRFLFQKLLASPTHTYEYIVENKIDWVFVDNVVWGHLLAERGLRENAEVAGQAIGVSNDTTPMSSVELMRLASAYYPDLTFRQLPTAILFPLMHLLDFLRSIFKNSFPRLGELEQLSQPSIMAASMNYRLRSDRAQKLLGYKALFAPQEAVALICAENEAGSA